jgi:hypothetical protein
MLLTILSTGLALAIALAVAAEAFHPGVRSV